MGQDNSENLVVGVDTGGTFTDFIWCDRGAWGEHKRLSTPADPAEAVLAGLSEIAGQRRIELVHGSTVATNAILEKKGACTALITNRHFEDILEIGRQNRPELYNLIVRKNPPLIPADRRFGIPGRVSVDGVEIEPFNPDAVSSLVERLAAAGVESIAVSLLFSFARPEHEQMVRKTLRTLDIPISLSHETLSEFREYERTSTTAINAYVAPKMENYIGRLRDSLGAARFRIMQSNGGSISAATAMRESVRTILSGPAGGVVGAWRIGQKAGFDKLITFDMGGTSTDVALLDGGLPLTTESAIAGYPVKVPMLDIHTVGAGGGSLAGIDGGGSLMVGPESAGADPGPICYGKGERITVTDANLFLGRLVPESFLGGSMLLQGAQLASTFAGMAAKLSLSPVELAQGVIDIADATMERAIKVISVERGFDPREFTLFSFGGAGGMHAASLASLLEIPRVLIPANPGILSAGGMLLADIIKDYSQTVMLTLTADSAAQLDTAFAPLLAAGEDDLRGEGMAPQAIACERYLDMRYKGQSYELMIPFSADYAACFHDRHQQMYGYANRDQEIEIVNVRLRAIGRPRRPELPRLEPGGPEPDAAARIGTGTISFSGESMAATIYDRSKLQGGNRIIGPAVIVEYSSTIVVPPGVPTRVDEWANLILETGGSR
ncbi:MAG: 5-oxoprolinase [Desulfuromonas sp.]|nr:MAG: 5-oxoprolinase [Desulfuromonas sp.]